MTVNDLLSVLSESYRVSLFDDSNGAYIYTINDIKYYNDEYSDCIISVIEPSSVYRDDINVFIYVD